MHMGILHDKDPVLAHILLGLLRQEPDLVVGDNAPYALAEDSDYSLPTHGARRGLNHVEIEIRQDLIATPDGQRGWAQRFSRVLVQTDAALQAADNAGPGSAHPG